MISPHKYTHIGSTERLIRGWQRLFATLVFLGCTLLLYCTSPVMAQTSLGTSQRFGVLGAAAVTNTGPTIINGDLGVSPGSSITGFPPGIVNGTIHQSDAVAAQAQADATTAYNTLAGLACNTVLTGQDLGGLTLTPGVYCFSSSAQLTGTLMLNAQGNPNAVFVFQIASTLTTASNSSVQIINGGQPCNVFWQVGSSATLGTNTSFIGSILANASITLNTNTTLSGRALALTGAVTLDNNKITATACAPTIGVSFNPVIINAGGVSTKTLTLINPNATPAALTAPLTDTLPAGLVIAATPNASTTCGGVLAAPAGSLAFSLTGGSIPGGAPGSCTITVNVTAAVGGTYINTLPAGSLQTSNGSNSAAAAATLTVVPPIGPPTLSVSFNPVIISAGGISTKTITLINPNATPATLTVPLTDNLPTGLVIAAIPNASTTCGGVLTAPAGGTAFSLTGGSIPGGSPGSCTVTVNVTAVGAGNYSNTLPAGALQTSNGSNTSSTTATLTVLPAIPIRIPFPSDTKPGSLLVFPFYKHDAQNKVDTRLTITNIGNLPINVHFLFIDGATCQEFDQFVCFTPHASITWKASEFDPQNKGYVIAYTVDNMGRPIAYNGLIGNGFVNDGEYVDNYGAESFSSSLPIGSPLGAVATPGLSWTIPFDGLSLDLAPTTFAVDIQSPLDAVNQKIVLAGLSGDAYAGKLSGVTQIGTGLAYNGHEALRSFSPFISSQCFAEKIVDGTNPKVTSTLASLIPKGEVGTLRFSVTAAVGLLMTSNQNAFGGIRTLHKVQVARSSIIIPLVMPDCQYWVNPA